MSAARSPLAGRRWLLAARRLSACESTQAKSAELEARGRDELLDDEGPDDRARRAPTSR